MAHFIKLHGLDDAEMLFNLDTVVSIDPLPEGTVICTRWGSTKVKEDLDTILRLSNSPAGASQNEMLITE
jgi:hypothetical protein|tara:strand:- start:2182 stop:2391 length:210 start_codon:yes stop_codon:yes gene_type:complete